MRTEPQVLWKLVEPPIAGAGLDLIELQWNREGEGWVLRVFIDRPQPPHLPGASEPPADVLPRLAVGHEDCERISRDLSAALDVADVIHHTYKLEVSSPGIDRPLRREQDFRRFAGQSVKIRCTEPSEGRRNFSGVLRGAQNGQVEVDCEGRVYQLPIATIARANLVPDWAAEFRRQDTAHAGEGGPHQPEPERKRAWEQSQGSHGDSKALRDHSVVPHAPHRSAS
jgi:ribosome maturation factor RimP